MANKIGRNKKWCEKYKQTGRREENKKIKQERHKKRMERFAQRREAGISYEYKKGGALTKLEEAKENGTDINFDFFKREWLSNYKSDRGKHTHYARMKSVFRKLQNEVDKIEQEKKDVERLKVKADLKKKQAVV